MIPVTSYTARQRSVTLLSVVECPAARDICTAKRTRVAGDSPLAVTASLDVNQTVHSGKYSFVDFIDSPRTIPQPFRAFDDRCHKEQSCRKEHQRFNRQGIGSAS